MVTVQQVADQAPMNDAVRHRFALAACRVGHFAADNAEADPAYAA